MTIPRAISEKPRISSNAPQKANHMFKVVDEFRNDCAMKLPPSQKIRLPIDSATLRTGECQTSLSPRIRICSKPMPRANWNKAV